MYENLSSNAKRLSSKNISNYQELLSINCQELLSEFYYSLEIAIKNNGLIFQALEENKIVGSQGRGRPIYECSYKGVIRRVAITVSNNGFIVGANPN